MYSRNSETPEDLYSRPTMSDSSTLLPSPRVSKYATKALFSVASLTSSSVSPSLNFIANPILINTGGVSLKSKSVVIILFPISQIPLLGLILFRLLYS